MLRVLLILSLSGAPRGPVPEGPAPALGLRRSAAGELAAGSVLSAAGLTGVVWMSLGLYVARMAERELAKGEGWSEAALAPLVVQRRQGETWAAGGAVLGVAGLALGLALLGAGARDLRRARSRGVIAPAPWGVSLAGRF